MTQMLILACLVASAAATALQAYDKACANYTTVENMGVVLQESLLKQVNATSVSQCCGFCTTTPTCAGFTWSSVKFTCRLTAVPKEHGPVDNVTSGYIAKKCKPVKRPPAPAPSTLPIDQRPNFVSILVDDLGFDDLRSHDVSSGVPSFTPNAAALMSEGVRLSRHHTYMWCSPTRRSFITGRYPVHITGIQAGTDTNLTPLQFTILSEKLQAAEYESHFIGKGHMGWHTTDHLLVNRGFTSHVGYLGGSQSYKCGTNTKDDTCAADWAIQHDMWHNETPGFDIVPQIKYSTDFYAKYAVERIEQRNTSKPLWLHVAMQAMHGGAYRENVPSGEELPLNTGFRNDGYGNALRSLDLAIGNITAALKANNLWDNTLLFVIADNGGDNPGGEASNYPLLGRKCLSWEGGTRVYALASGGLIPADRRGKSADQLMHISDWYATFTTMAGLDPSDKWVDPNTTLTHDIDGVNVWPAISQGASAKTREWLPTTHKSLLWDQTHLDGGHMWKLVQGNETQAMRFYANGSTYDDPHNPCLTPVFKTFDCVNSVGQKGGGGRDSCVVCTDESPCLYDVMNDPSETMNVANDPKYAEILQTMKEKLETFKTPYVPAALSDENLACYNCSFDPKAMWKNFSGPGCVAK